MAKKRVSQISLKGTGEIIETSLERGQAARRAMAAGDGVLELPEQDNRMIDVRMIGEVKDIWIEDMKEVEATVLRLMAPELDKADTSGPGYKHWLAARDKLRRKMGLPPVEKK